MIKCNNIFKIYKSGDIETSALKGVSFEITDGEFVTIVGPSGSGKSTLMHIIGALDIPTSGTYLLDNINVQNMGDDQLSEIRNQKIGFIFQSYNLLPRMTSLKNVILPMIYSGYAKEKRKQRALEVLNQV